LTVEEREQLHYYGSDGEAIRKLNAALRGGPQSDEYNRARAEAEPINNALLKLPAYEGLTHRTLNFETEEALNGFLSDHIVNEPVLYNAFTSTSLDPEIFGGTKVIKPGQHRVVMRIRGRSGRNISEYSPFKEKEMEVLFPLDSSFIVTEVKKHEWGHEIFMKEAES
jgi:hypothetical protein